MIKADDDDPPAGATGFPVDQPRPGAPGAAWREPELLRRSGSPHRVCWPNNNTGFRRSWATSSADHPTSWSVIQAKAHHRCPRGQRGGEEPRL